MQAGLGTPHEESLRNANFGKRRQIMLIQVEQEHVSSLSSRLFLNQCAVALSDSQSWGVFAKTDMPAGATVEQSIVRAPDDQYWFVWEHGRYVFGSGFSQLYNHCDEPNVEVIRDYANSKMYFCAVADVQAGQELFHRYPDWARYQQADGKHGARETGASAAARHALERAAARSPALPQMVSPKLNVGPSPVDRLGVFAQQDISAGELIEVALVRPADAERWFAWRTPSSVFCSGIAHFFRDGPPNTAVIRDDERSLLRFRLTRDVTAGEELVVSEQARV
jgi:hypothetical protein